MPDDHTEPLNLYEAFLQAFEELLGEYLDAVLEEAGLADAQVEQLMAAGWDAGRAWAVHWAVVSSRDRIRTPLARRSITACIVSCQRRSIRSIAETTRTSPADNAGQGRANPSGYWSRWSLRSPRRGRCVPVDVGLAQLQGLSIRAAPRGARRLPAAGPDVTVSGHTVTIPFWSRCGR